MSWFSRALQTFAPAVRLDSAPLQAVAVREDACGGASPTNYGGLGYGGPGYGAIGLTRKTIDILSVDQLMARIIHRIVEDATKIDPDLSGPTLGQLDEVWDYLGKNNFKEQEFRGLSYGRQYGGGALLIMVDDGRDLSEPIDLLNIRTLRGFVDLEKYNCTPGPPSSKVEGAWWGPQWGRPQYYSVTSYIAANEGIHSGIGGGQQVHPSRVIPYQHRRWLNSRQARDFVGWNGWGPGVVEAIYQPFTARTEGVMRTNGIIRSFGYDHVKLKNMEAVLEGPEGAGRLMSFLENLKACRDYTEGGVPVVVTGPEADISPLSRNVSGLDKLVEVQRDFLLDYLEYPRVVIFGVTQGGLSDAASGEWQTYYQWVASYQANTRWPGIRQAAIVAMAAKDGPTSGRVDFGITAAWASMAEENEADKSKSRKDNAEAREKDALVLGIDQMTLALFDPTVEESYPGLQAAIENGTVTVGAPVAEVVPTAEMPGDEVAPAIGSEGPSPGVEPPGDEAGADAVPVEPVPFIPDDLVAEAAARKMLKCGMGTFAKWVREEKVTPWKTGGGRRYSMAEVVSAARGDSFRWDSRMDPFPEEHTARQMDPSGLTRFRLKPSAEGVVKVLAEGKRGNMVTQSVRFSSAVYTVSEAKEWLRENGLKTNRFEEATGGRSETDSRMDRAVVS